jgi:quercetin 2,3-dioxygenase
VLFSIATQTTAFASDIAAALEFKQSRYYIVRLSNNTSTITTTTATNKATTATTQRPAHHHHQQQQQDTSSTCSLTTTTKNNNNNNNNNDMPHFRSIRKILPRQLRHWVGDGFHVHPVFADAAFTEDVSPLLMFDYANPKEFAARKHGESPRGVGKHPHKGFETVTVAFQGQVEHQDSAGNTGVIDSGDVQWMTAGRGIVHQEFHSNKFTETGGTFEMLQLWVNLPKKHKRTKPSYQSILKNDIPVVPIPTSMSAASVDSEQDLLGTVRLIAGEFNGIKGAASTYSPVQMWDVSLPTADAVVDLPYPADHNCIIFCRRGSVEIVSGNDDDGDDDNANDSRSSSNNKLKSSTLGPQDVALMHYDGSTTLRLKVKERDSSIMILGGEPLNEPIAAHGPFVMNTQDEINQAISDYRMGKF